MHPLLEEDDDEHEQEHGQFVDSAKHGAQTTWQGSRHCPEELDDEDELDEDPEKDLQITLFKEQTRSLQQAKYVPLDLLTHLPK